MEHNMSAPMLALVYLITRGPVYDMYLLKLFSVCCYMTLALLVTRAADKKGFGVRAEVDENTVGTCAGDVPVMNVLQENLMAVCTAMDLLDLPESDRNLIFYGNMGTIFDKI